MNTTFHAHALRNDVLIRIVSVEIVLRVLWMMTIWSKSGLTQWSWYGGAAFKNGARYTAREEDEMGAGKGVVHCFGNK